MHLVKPMPEYACIVTVGPRDVGGLPVKLRLLSLLQDSITSFSGRIKRVSNSVWYSTL